MSIIGKRLLRNAAIVWWDLTHLMMAPPNIPKDTHFTEVFCEIVIHPFICSVIQQSWQTKGMRHD